MAKDIEVEIFLSGGKKFEGDLNNIEDQSRKTEKGFSKLSRSIITLNQGFQLLGGAVRVASRAISSITRIGAAAIQAGSDFEEANQKFSVVFNSLSQQSDDARQDLVKNFGLSQKAATDLLGSTGDLLTGFGFTQNSALELSTTVNKLAVDLASFQTYRAGLQERVKF